MAIHSNFLGSVTVTGDDAKAFTRQIARGRVSQAAIEAVKNGRKLLAEYDKKGFATVKPRMTSQSSKK
jgi:hypothetical protein